MNKSYPLIKYLVFLVSAVAMFGSLYFSEVMHLPPCSLCWYQRICMYPLAVVSFVNILNTQFDDYKHEFVLAAIGIVIASYHNLLYYGFIENIVPCTQGVSCTSRQIEWFGFITIPLLSFVGFATILILIGLRKILIARELKL